MKRCPTCPGYYPSHDPCPVCPGCFGKIPDQTREAWRKKLVPRDRFVGIARERLASYRTVR